jgi:hypothetical protein
MELIKTVTMEEKVLVILESQTAVCEVEGCTAMPFCDLVVCEYHIKNDLKSKLETNDKAMHSNLNDLKI